MRREQVLLVTKKELQGTQKNLVAIREDLGLEGFELFPIDEGVIGAGEVHNIISLLSEPGDFGMAAGDSGISRVVGIQVDIGIRVAGRIHPSQRVFGLAL